MLISVLPVLKRPKYSSINIGLLPPPSTAVGLRINVGIGLAPYCSSLVDPVVDISGLDTSQRAVAILPEFLPPAPLRAAIVAARYRWQHSLAIARDLLECQSSRGFVDRQVAYSLTVLRKKLN